MSGKEKQPKQKSNLLSVRKAAQYFKRLWPYLKPNWPQLILVVIGMVLFSTGYALRLAAIKPVVEIAGDPENVSAEKRQGIIQDLIPSALILFGGALSMAIGTYLKHYFTGWLVASTRINLQRDIVSRVLALPMAFFNKERKGALITRMTSNASNAGKLVKLMLENILSNPLTMFAVVGVMIYTSPILTLFTLVVFPVALIPVLLFAGKISKATKKKYQRSEVAGNFFLQMLDGIRVVKSYRLEEAQREDFRRVSQEVFRKERKVSRYKGASRFGVELTYNTLMAGALFGVGLIFTTAWFHESGGFGVFVQFFACLILLYDPARKLGHSLNELQESTAGLEAALKLLDSPNELQDRDGANEAPREFATIEFRDVSFQYEPDRPVLRGLNFEVKRGQFVAFVGQSGHGKSTLMDLIPRFYDPTAGSVLVDGIDLKDLKLDSWLKNIAIVSQETFLFNTTIRDNILSGAPDATEEEVIAAARHAHIWDDIQGMPKGLDTPLGDRGVTVSGGQRQRIAIARAFLRKAPLLLLDEATSSLDTRSERVVQEALDELVEGCTVFAVAHRLSTIRRADLILMLHEGRVIERGSHDELVAQNGAYAAAWRLQQGEQEKVEAA